MEWADLYRLHCVGFNLIDDAIQLMLYTYYILYDDNNGGGVGGGRTHLALSLFGPMKNLHISSTHTYMYES